MHEHLTNFVHPDRDQQTWADLGKLFAHEVFARRSGLTYAEQVGLTYERLAALGAIVPNQLFPILERAAVTSPPLFVALTIHHCLALGALREYGEGRADGHIHTLESGSAVGVLLATEAGSGNSHMGIRTEARYRADTREFELRTPDQQARKFMPNTGLPGVAKLGVVLARLLVADIDRGVFAFVVPLRDEHSLHPGVSIEPLPDTPYAPLDHALTGFDGVRVPLSALLRDGVTLTPDGAFNDPLADPDERLLRTLRIRQNAWVACAAGLAAACRSSVATAIDFSATRTTHSRYAPELPVLAYRTQQHALYTGLATAYAMTALANRAKRAYRHPDREGVWAAPALGRTLGLAKALTASVTDQIAAECGQRCGAHGMFGALPEYHGFGHILGPAAGDSLLIVLEAGRAMAKGVVYTPPASDSTDHEWLALALAREVALHRDLVDELDQAARREQRPFEFWNDRLQLARELAEAHGHRLALECLYADARDCAPIQPLLSDLAALYAVGEVARHAGWYLTHDLISLDQARDLPALRNRLCARVHPHVPQLVRAINADPIPR